MRLTAWTWMIFGAIIAVVSGYIYLFIPKNGGHNNAMAMFFFIGIIFIVIGVIQLFYKRVDDKEIFESVKNSEKKSPERVIDVPIIEFKPNRIEEEINKMVAQQEKPAMKVGSLLDKPTHHSNTYYQLHQYSGPVHSPSTGTHAQHPVNQHMQHSQTNAALQHRVQNVAEHSLKCIKCGNVNSGHSNYCHQCGNRLK
jgi:hypothetical protein